MATYIALRPVRHSQSGELIEPGDEVDVSHLDRDEIAALKDRGVIAPSSSSEAKSAQENESEEG